MSNRPTLARPSKKDAEAEATRNFLSIINQAGVKTRLAQLLSTPEAADRLIRLMAVAAGRTPKLRLCTRDSVLQAMLLLAALDLDPNGPLGQAYLIPYARRGKVDGVWVDVAVECQVQIGYRGLLELASKVPGWQSISAEAVYEHDDFDFDNGSANFLRHRKKMTGDRGVIIGAYAIVHVNGGTTFRVLTRSELDSIRDQSETYTSAVRALEKAQKDKSAKDIKTAEKDLAATPWVKWEDEMAAKSAIKRLLKVLPLGRHKESQRVAVAAAVDDRLLDLSAVTLQSDPLEAPLQTELAAPDEDPMEHLGADDPEGAPLTDDGTDNPEGAPVPVTATQAPSPRRSRGEDLGA
ncbi:MAG: hypothetical protein EAZ99_07865 [Alphaproteobacteria bacterium]|nr:MAG: hypothetical protein EAZ99_07865 [Alphaproteobacteria bacterium]